MSTRYTLIAGKIQRQTYRGYGSRSFQDAKRVPKPVREALRGRTGPTEVEYNAKTRVAKVVPPWEMWVSW